MKEGKMEKWEYKVIELDQIHGSGKTENNMAGSKEDEEALMELGKQGWELVSITEPECLSMRRKAYLKKRK